MSALCDECSHKSICIYKKDFEHIINRINNVYLITSTKVSDTKHLDDFEWFSYTPHCKYFCEQKPTTKQYEKEE